MATVQDHPHSFLPAAWPFAEPINTLAYTSARVLDGHPVLLVFHDHDGEWQFLHGEVDEQDECKIICLGCAYERENAVGILADLPAGWKLQENPSNVHGSASHMRTVMKTRANKRFEWGATPASFACWRSAPQAAR